MFSKGSDSHLCRWACYQAEQRDEVDKGEEIKGHRVEKGHEGETWHGQWCGTSLEGRCKWTLGMTESFYSSVREDAAFCSSRPFLFFISIFAGQGRKPKVLWC